MSHSYIEIIILSFIQGFTEFLPISSSGHLIIAPKLFGWQDQGLEIDVAVHVGTLLSVLLYFREDLSHIVTEILKYIFSGFKKDKFTVPARLGFILVVATLPAIFFGFLLKKIGIDMVRHVWIVATASIIFGIILYIADQQKQRFDIQKMNFKSGILIGLAQALALIPGTSRSGACITMGRFLGYSRPPATRFAFILSIPAILGAGILTAIDAVKEGQDLLNSHFLVAILASFTFGLLAIHFMIRFVSRHGLGVFTIYRILLGIILFAFYV